MKKKPCPLPTWFPLDIYSKKNLSAKKWLDVMTFHMGVKTIFNNTLDKEKALALFKIFILDNPESPNKEFKEHGIRWPIDSLSVFENSYLNAIPKSNPNAKKWQRFAKKLVKEPTKYLLALHKKRYADGVCGGEAIETLSPQVLKYGMEILDYRVPISIDLTYDDETLKETFGIWLAGMRSQFKESIPKPIDEKDLRKWEDFQILAAFDLKLWAEINNLHFTDAQMGNILFPNESFVDTTERYRKVVKPMINEIFDWKFLNRFSSQMDIADFVRRKLKNSEFKNQENIPE